LRVSSAGNSRFLFEASVLSIKESGQGTVLVRTAQAELEYDFLVFATGFRADLQQRPEFAPFAEHIRFWGDRFEAPADEQDAELAALPDLGSCFEFLEKQPGSCPGLHRIHCFSYPAALSYGAVSGDIPAISEGARRMAQGLVSQLFSDDIDLHFQAMQDYADPELLGDEWVAGELTAEERR
jgi:cation diffusion facilitator CzcD-associated flavoprotein CzcO